MYIGYAKLAFIIAESVHKLLVLRQNTGWNITYFVPQINYWGTHVLPVLAPMGVLLGLLFDMPVLRNGKQNLLFHMHYCAKQHELAILTQTGSIRSRDLDGSLILRR